MTDEERNSKPYRMNTSGDDDIVEDDHFDKEAAYDSWQENPMAGGVGFFHRYWVLLVLLILVFLGLYLFYSAMRPKSDPVRLSQTPILDSRVDDLELRLSRLEEKAPKANSSDIIGTQAEALGRLSNRMDRLESSFKTRMDEITANVGAAPKKPITQKPAAQKPVVKAKPKKPVSAEKKESKIVVEKKKPAPAVSAKAQYHTVQPEETLYRISLKYGLSVDRIKELNRLPNNIIKPGQKLRVSP